MVTDFETSIAACRQTYGVYQQLAARTNDALYAALGEVYRLCLHIRTDPNLETAWHELLLRHIGDKPVNETLFLVKHAFFPDTLQPGPGHKADITKASRYAKLINRALDQGIDPADFVTFARDQGIQRTAIGTGAGKRSCAPAVRRPRSRSRRYPAPRSVRSSLLTAMLRPLAGWFYSSEVAARLAAILQAAQDQPHKLSLTLYVNHERAVLTGVSARPIRGDFPEGAVRIKNIEPAQPPTAPMQRPPFTKAAPLCATSGPAMPTRLSARIPPPDGFVWPDWRRL
jgi:hypothetical protein